MPTTLTESQLKRILKVLQLLTFKTLADNEYKNLSSSEKSTYGLTSNTVKAALGELKTAIGNNEITFEKLTLANTGKLATYRFTKGTGVSATTLDIDIEKDLINNNFELVTIVEGTEENAGKYYDGVTEVGASQGVSSAGVYLKAQSSEGTYSYANMAGVIEYLTVGAQGQKNVKLTINSDHTITAEIGLGEAFSAEKAYAQGDFVIKDGHLYKFTSAHSAGAWIITEGSEDYVEVSDELVSIGPDGKLKLVGKKLSDLKEKQTAVTSIASASTALKTLASLSQNANGEISYTLQDIPTVIASENGLGGSNGLMTPAQAEKLAGLSSQSQLTADLDSKANKVGEPFSTEKAYSNGEYVTYNNKLYKFTSNHSAGAWITTEGSEDYIEVTGSVVVIDGDGDIALSEYATDSDIYAIFGLEMPQA